MARNISLRRIFLDKQIPVTLFIAILVAFAFIMRTVLKDPPEKISASVSETLSTPCPANMNVFTKKGDEFIRPLLMVELPEQSSLLLPLKNVVKEKIDLAIKENKIFNASVYLLRLKTGDWIGINNEMRYSSTGYIRVAMLITYLKMAEADKSVLAKKIFYPLNGVTSPEIKNEKSLLQPNRSYSVNELLSVMMSTADTSSRWLLMNNMNYQIFSKLFNDVGLAMPDLEHRKFTITVQEYSRFLHLLYNGTYLEKDYSEYALSLLSQGYSKKGMTKLLPADIKVIHRMGERFENKKFELRESGIIYANDVAYLLTIFTNGVNREELESTSSEIAKAIYDNFHDNM